MTEFANLFIFALRHIFGITISPPLFLWLDLMKKRKSSVCSRYSHFAPSLAAVWMMKERNDIHFYHIMLPHSFGVMRTNLSIKWNVGTILRRSGWDAYVWMCVYCLDIHFDSIAFSCIKATIKMTQFFFPFHHLPIFLVKKNLVLLFSFDQL